MKNDIYDLPEDLFDFAYIPNFHTTIEKLSQMAEDEDWGYHVLPSIDTNYPILENYTKHTYQRIAVEKKVAYSKDKKYCCFDLGLLTRSQREPIYVLFTENSDPNYKTYWQFHKYFRRGEADARYFVKLPEMAFYWEDPSKLIFDPRKELNVNYEHIIQDNKSRFPTPYNQMDDYKLSNYIKGCIESVKEKLKRNYKIAVPQYFLTSGTIQLLIPLCLASPDKADLAIVVEDYGDMYRAATCLPLDLAINNARLLARPDRDWLNP